jgi:hypothetical protein
MYHLQSSSFCGNITVLSSESRWMHTWLSALCWVLPSVCHFSKADKLVFSNWVPRQMCVPDNSHYKNGAKRSWNRWTNCLYHLLDRSCEINCGYTWFLLSCNQNVTKRMINILAWTGLTEKFVNIWDFSCCCCCHHVCYCHICCCYLCEFVWHITC